MIKTGFMQLMEELDKLNEDASVISYGEISNFLDSFVDLGDPTITALQNNDTKINNLLDQRRHIDADLMKQRAANKRLLNASTINKTTYMKFKNEEQSMQTWSYVDAQPLHGPRRFATFYLTNQFESAVNNNIDGLQTEIVNVIKQAEGAAPTDTVKVQRTGDENSLSHLSHSELRKTDFSFTLNNKELKVEAKIKLFAPPKETETNNHAHKADYLVVLDFYTEADDTTMKFGTKTCPVYIYKHSQGKEYTRLTGPDIPELTLTLKDVFNPLAFPNNWNNVA